MLVMANFKLSESLQLFMKLGARKRRFLLGEHLYISVRPRYDFFQEIVLYPMDGYQFLTQYEIDFVLRAAIACSLDVVIKVENNLPVIVVTDYNIKKS